MDAPDYGPPEEFVRFMDATIAWYSPPEYGEAFDILAGAPTMDFGSAIQAVKAGHRLCRDQWRLEEPGRHIRLENLDKVVDVGGTIANPGPEARVDESGVITRKFSPGDSDLLAEDWLYWNHHLGTARGATAGDPLAQRVVCEVLPEPGGFTTVTHDPGEIEDGRPDET